MNLVLDVGNTRYKLGFFEAGELLKTYETTSQEECLQLIHAYPVKQGIIASVRASSEVAKQLPFKCLTLTHLTPLPIIIEYETPQTLGTDRMAAVVGAMVLYPGQDCLVIDMGTCITYDIIESLKIFKGGTIAPGVKMRLDAMHQFTQKLPLVPWISDKNSSKPRLLAKSTHEALLSGAVNGVEAEMKQIILSHQQYYPDLKVILCGGDAKYFDFFETLMKGVIFVVPKLVLYGLNRILEYNVNQKN